MSWMWARRDSAAERRSRPRRYRLACAAVAALAVLALTRRASADVAILTDPSVSPYAETTRALVRGTGPSFHHYDVRSSAAVAAIRADRPELVVAVGQRALDRAARELAELPVVFACVLAPDQYRLRSTVTGVPLEASPEAYARALAQIVPRGRRVGIVYEPTAFAAYVRRFRAAFEAAGLSLVEARVANMSEVPGAVRRVMAETQAFVMLPDASLWTRDTLSFTLLHGLERRQPVVGFLDAITQAGATLSVAPDYNAIGSRARQLVNEILARPAAERTTVPPFAYVAGRVSVNTATATRIGVRLPEQLARNGRIFRK